MLLDKNTLERRFRQSVEKGLNLRPKRNEKTWELTEHGADGSCSNKDDHVLTGSVL